MSGQDTVGGGAKSVGIVKQTNGQEAVSWILSAKDNQVKLGDLVFATKDNTSCC